MELLNKPIELLFKSNVGNLLMSILLISLGYSVFQVYYLKSNSIASSQKMKMVFTIMIPVLIAIVLICVAYSLPQYSSMFKLFNGVMVSEGFTSVFNPMPLFKSMNNKYQQIRGPPKRIEIY